MKRTITVLQDDIDNGVREHARKCAVARALCRDLADLAYLADLIGASYANVTPGLLYLGCDQVPTPPVVAEFIARFDSGQPVEPFKFEIEVPQ